MTVSAPVATPAVQGAQEPRVSCVPPYISSSGQEAIELCEMAGLYLDPWQQMVLAESLGERPNGKWSAFEVGLVCSRQNGKNEILLARELVGLFLLDERLIVHSAHEFATASEHHVRIAALIEGAPHLRGQLKGIKYANGKESIELKGGQRLVFKARSKGSGRGFTADLVVLDEAMDISEAAHGVILPTLSARPNPQVWYAGSAVDRWSHDNGVVFARVRERGHRGDDPALAYFEWSVDARDPMAVDSALARDPEAWAEANPGLGIRISSEHVEREQRSMDARTFAVERLGVGDWPATDDGEGGWAVIGEEPWTACADIASVVRDPVCFAVDVTPDRSRSSIGVAGLRSDGRSHVEVVEHSRGTGWVVARLKELVESHDCNAVVLDGSGPAASLLPDLAVAEIEVMAVSSKEHGQACGQFFDGVDSAHVRHLGDPVLADAVKGAVKRSLGDAWAWSRKTSGVDISPLVAVTLAHWGAIDRPVRSNEAVIF